MSGTQNTVPLDALVELRLEKVASYKDPELPYVGLEHLAAGRPTLLGTLPSSASVSINGVFARDDILFGKLRPNLRKSLRAPFPGYCSTDILVLRARDGVRPDFTGHLFQWKPIFASAAASAAGTKMPRTSWGEVKRYPVRKPESEAEQARIAAVLDTADEALAKTEAVIAKLRQMRTGLIHDLLTCGLDANGHLRDPIAYPEQFADSPIGRIPKCWEIAPLIQGCEKIADRDHTTPIYVTEGVRMVSPTHFKEEEDIDFESCPHITPEAHAVNRLKTDLRVNDVIIHRIGAGLGRVRLVKDGMPEFSILHSLALIRAKTNRYNPQFLCWVLQTEFVQFQFGLGTQSIGVPDLGLDKIGSILVPRPEIEEQKAISEILNDVAQDLKAEQQYLLKLQSIKSGLMDDLLTGRVRVPEGL